MRLHELLAQQMEPSNEEYVRAFYSVNDPTGFGGYGAPRTNSMDDCCQICIPLWCCCGPGPGPCC